MGFFDYMKKIRNGFSGETSDVITSDGRGAVYSQFGSNIYASEIVNQAVACIAGEIKKLNPKHVVNSFDQTAEINDDINRILKNPNELMTTADFLECCTYRLMEKANVFIYPTYITSGGQKTFTGLYPLKPSNVQFIEDAIGTMFVEFTFNNGSSVILPYSEIIHWRYRFSTDDFMGGNADGTMDNLSLIETLQLNKSVRASMEKAANAPVNGVVKYGSVISESKLAEAVERFNTELKNSKSGILAIDAKSEFQQMANNLKIVDAETMDFIKQEIVDHFGVSLPMLHSIATVEEKQSFYDKTIEPMVLSLNQAFTRCLITPGRRDRNHEIVFYEKNLLFMTMDQKIAFVDTVKDLGALTNNQIIGIFGYPPYPGGDVRVQSLNNVDADIANDYQLNNSGAADSPSSDTPAESEGENNE